MVKKKYYNPKTGQSTSDPLFAKKAGATTTEERRQTNIEQSNKEIALKNEQARLQGQKYYVGTGQVSRSDYEKRKREMGTSLDPRIIAQQPKEMIKEDPSQFGLQIPGQEQVTPEGFEITTEEAEKQKLLKREFPTSPAGALGVDLTPIPQELGGYPDVQTIPEMAASFVGGVAGGVSSVGVAWKVGEKIFSNGAKAARAGTALKNSKAAAPLYKKVAGWAIGAFAALKTVEGVVNYFGGRKVDEQQQAINTLGQMATTIGGDSTEATGDWRKGLQELNYIKKEILRLESAIKAGTIVSAKLKFDGKIYDVNADMADQLATIDEQIRIINSFVVTQSFPEVTELEIQGILRELEEEGYIQAVDLTTSRRPTE